MPDGPMSYEDTCRYVGQLFLATRDQLERLTRENAALREAVAAAQRERDEALKLVGKGGGA
jgi:hypothetical protein